MKAIALLHFLFLTVFLAMFANAEGINTNKKDSVTNTIFVTDMTCKPKKRDPTVLPGFNAKDLYDYDKVRMWYVGSPSEFIPSEIKTDENGIEIMKGKMIGFNGRRAHVEFKHSSKFTYDIYTPKSEWDCVSTNR